MTKYFTPKEASKTLPYVKRLVADALGSGKKIKGLYDVYGEEVQKREDYQEALTTFDNLMLEFQQLGCDYKDWNFEIGLVDFPAQIDGEEVCLCWKSDEESLLYYHGINAGFSGRKPIPQTMLN
jgi:hypothetical protein